MTSGRLIEHLYELGSQFVIRHRILSRYQFSIDDDERGEILVGIDDMTTSSFKSPVHTHTYDYYAVVIKGTLENYQPGQKPVKLGPGSYWYQRGKQAHTTACVSKEPCEIYIVQQNKFDAQIPPKTE